MWTIFIRPGILEFAAIAPQTKTRQFLNVHIITSDIVRYCIVSEVT